MTWGDDRVNDCPQIKPRLPPHVPWSRPDAKYSVTGADTGERYSKRTAGVATAETMKKVADVHYMLGKIREARKEQKTERQQRK